jgi:3-hydroxyisobutyrate dehydrogenase
MTKQKIAILGCGAMGSRMVQNLLNANHQVVVYNRTATKIQPLIDRGALYAATPKAAAEQADIVISMVTDDDVSRRIWLDPETGALLSLNKDRIAIESSTLTIAWTRELASMIEARGAMFLDAPVVGSRPQVEAGKLIYLVGGKAEILEQVQPILSSAGAAVIHHIGAIGQGMAMKLAVNTLFGVQVAALAEILGLLDKQGITSTKAMEYLGDLPVTSLAAKMAGNLMVANNHAPLFPIELVEKDFRYVVQTAQATNTSIPAAAAIHRIYQDAIAQGRGSENITGVVQLFV